MKSHELIIFLMIVVTIIVWHYIPSPTVKKITEKEIYQECMGYAQEDGLVKGNELMAMYNCTVISHHACQLKGCVK